MWELVDTVNSFSLLVYFVVVVVKSLVAHMRPTSFRLLPAAWVCHPVIRRGWTDGKSQQWKPLPWDKWVLEKPFPLKVLVPPERQSLHTCREDGIPGRLAYRLRAHTGLLKPVHTGSHRLKTHSHQIAKANWAFLVPFPCSMASWWQLNTSDGGIFAPPKSPNTPIPIWVFCFVLSLRASW